MIYTRASSMCVFSHTVQTPDGLFASLCLFLSLSLSLSLSFSLSLSLSLSLSTPLPPNKGIMGVFFNEKIMITAVCVIAFLLLAM